MRRFIAVVLLSLPLCAQAGLPQPASVPGGMAVVPLGKVEAGQPRPLVWYGGQQVLVTAEGGQWYAVVGIPLDTRPGMQELRTRIDGATQVRKFEVAAKAYPEQHITIQDKGKVELSPQNEVRATREIAEIKQLKHHWREAPDTDLAFVAPAEGPLASRFGLRRFFNEKPRAPHAGLDVAVARGSPVHAVSAGRVLAAAEYFFNGNTLFIDHGNGVITMYCHLDRIDVKVGDEVAKGQQVALSGMTGRATGPHLHWSVVMNGAMVDPELFFRTGH